MGISRLYKVVLGTKSHFWMGWCFQDDVFMKTQIELAMNSKRTRNDFGINSKGTQ